MNGLGYTQMPGTGLPASQEDDFLSKLSPEQVRQFMELGGMDEQNAELDAQMQQALALQQGSGIQHTTPGGAVLGGLADMLNGLRGSNDAKDVRKTKEGLRAKRASLRGSIWEAIAGGGKPQSPDPYWGGQAFGDPNARPPEALAAPSPFGFGGGGGGYGYTPGGWK